MSELLEELQYKIKTSSTSIGVFFFKLVSGLFFGLAIALVFEEIIKYGTLGFVFVLLAVAGAFMRVMKSWNFIGVLVFDLICVLIGLLLHMYILMAPGG